MTAQTLPGGTPNTGAEVDRLLPESLQILNVARRRQVIGKLLKVEAEGGICHALPLASQRAEV
jgi:hypothetical protein